MPVRVKICGITRVADVVAAVAAGADAVGFVFTPRSKRFMTAAEAKILAHEVPAFVSRVGLFLDQDAAEVTGVLEQVPLSLLQFHGNEDAAFCRQFGLPYLKAVSMVSGQDAAVAGETFHDAAGLLFDSHEPGGAGGTGHVFDWSGIPHTGRPLVLAGGLTPANVASAVQQVKPWAVDVSSGVEDAPGRKNAAKMQTFIKEAKREY